jgi:uncharacterized membrane protein YoaK (UPF0700 family)
MDHREVIALLLLLAVAVVAFVVGNAAANKLSRPLERSGPWRSLFS